MPPRVTLAMLSEKDSPTLARCLESCADLVDEIVIVTQPGASSAWRSAIDRFSPKLVGFLWRDDFCGCWLSVWADLGHDTAPGSSVPPQGGLPTGAISFKQRRASR